MSDMEAAVRQAIDEHIAVQQLLAESCTGAIARIAEALGDVLVRGGTIYLCGNGGSAADAQHVAAEFVGRFLRERRALPAVALTTNTSILTAIGNDYDYSQVFERQVRACVTDRDAVAGISTSGNSANVVRALAAARQAGARTIGFVGQRPGAVSAASDLCLHVPSTQTPRIQEAHILAWHIVCDLVEQRMVACDATRRVA